MSRRCSLFASACAALGVAACATDRVAHVRDEAPAATAYLGAPPPRENAACVRRVARDLERELAARRDRPGLGAVLGAALLGYARDARGLAPQVARWSLGPLADGGGYAAATALDFAHPGSPLPPPRFAPDAFAAALASVEQADLALWVAPADDGRAAVRVVRAWGAAVLARAAGAALGVHGDELARCARAAGGLHAHVEARSVVDPMAPGLVRRRVHVALAPLAR